MATYTTNYNLEKPDASDDFGDFQESYNANMDIIDQNLGGGGGGGGSSVSWNQIQATGEKIAEITINGTTTDVLIPFEAKIIVTTTTGLTVTATKGGTTYTATETSSGVYEVIVDSKGTWTVTDGTNTTTVNVTAQTTYNVAFVVIPDGSTVTPTDDIQIWLHCGNIWDKNYTTLAEVLADSTTLSALISSNNAVDYLVRSTTWAATICDNSTAMTYIGLNNYCANTLLADSTWRSAICNSAYFESVLNVKVPVMTSATTPSGVAFDNGSYNNNSPAWHSFSEQVNKYWVSPDGSGAGKYFGYEFTSAVKIFKAVIDSDASYATETYAFNSAKIQATNDNDWSAPIDLQSYNNPGLTNYSFIFNNPTAYSKYRWICTAYSGGKYYGGMKLQFYGREDV